MKKAKQILLLIGGILSIVYLVSFIISGAVLLLLGSPALTEAIKSGLENGAIHSDLPGGVETVQAFLSTFGATMLIFAIFSIFAAIFSFAAKRSGGKAINILCVVFGILSGAYPSAVGGVFGIIIEERKRSGNAEISD